ncbi:MAG: MBL fold metallo-hydrolase [Marinicellaceae bacterium]
MKTLILFFILTTLELPAKEEYEKTSDTKNNVQLIILGIAQDAGYPQINCYKPHCLPAWKNHKLKKLATSLGLIDDSNKQKYLFEATPDIRQQLYNLHKIADDSEYKFSGIFLTHAHMGHYTGLMHLGREAAGTDLIPVYAMPKMKEFLKNNGPWSQLIKLKNILIKDLKNQNEINLSTNLSIIPFLVPHRDEFSETVGYKIKGPNKTAMFIPDIDKWKKWDQDILKEIQSVDYALLDATFFENGEIPNRDMSEIPHPFVTESMELFSALSDTDKRKVYFIHFNHTNPLLHSDEKTNNSVTDKGFNIASEGLKLNL